MTTFSSANCLNAEPLVLDCDEVKPGSQSVLARSVDDRDTWRDHTWEFAVDVFSWLVALVALVFVVAYVAHDAYKTRRRNRRKARR